MTDETISILNQALTTQHWEHVNRKLVSKMLSELLYEGLIFTSQTRLSASDSEHVLIVSSGVWYRFKAQVRIFDNWHIDSDSIMRFENDVPSLVTMVSQFICDTHTLIGITGLTLGHLLRELNHTLIADCHALSLQKNVSSDDLLRLSNDELEGFMQGHPWFIVNKGRLGFSYDEYLKHAPEMQNKTNLIWVAVHKKHAVFHAISDLNYETIITQELAPTEITSFSVMLSEKKLIATDYYFMPIHEWQWRHQIITLFTEDIVKQDLVYLGPGKDTYLPTQSIRTFVNQMHTTKYQVKLPISIFNTAVYRGLPSERTQHAPLLSEWLRKKLKQDIFFHANCRLVLLSEIASIDYPHKHYMSLEKVPYQYKECLGVIWRENVHIYLKPEERAITMAALIHIDYANKPLISTLIEKSGLTLENWLTLFFSVVMPPLLHWLYRYGVVFSPHGENTLLVIKENRPVGLVIKDFIDDVNISEQDLPESDDLPPSLKKLLLKVSDDQLTQFIHTGLFVVLYRYVSDILQTYHHYSEINFWELVRSAILDYQKSQPNLNKRFKQFDLFKPSFNKLCLNKLRLLTVGYQDDVNRPKVAISGSINNPVNHLVLNTWRIRMGIQHEKKYDL